MHVSSARTMTSSSGALAPGEALCRRVDVDDGRAEALADGCAQVRRERLARARDHGGRVGQARVGKTRESRRVAHQQRRAQLVQPGHDLRQPVGDRNGQIVEREAAARGQTLRGARRMDRGAGADHPDRQAARRHGVHRLDACCQATRERTDEADRGAHVVHEDAAYAGAASRRERDVAVAHDALLVAGLCERLLDLSPRGRAVDEDVVELVHHLRLRHDRQSAQVRGVDLGRVDAGEAASVEGRSGDRIAQERLQADALVGEQLLAIPAGPLDELGVGGEQLGSQAIAQRRERGGGGGGHGSS